MYIVLVFINIYILSILIKKIENLIILIKFTNNYKAINIFTINIYKYVLQIKKIYQFR